MADIYVEKLSNKSRPSQAKAKYKKTHNKSTYTNLKNNSKHSSKYNKKLIRKESKRGAASCSPHLSITTVLLVFIFVIGISLFLYPTVSNYWNRLHSSRAISGYSQQVEELDPETCRQLIEQARAYNEKIADLPLEYAMDDDRIEEYQSLLDINGDGIMGYIDIPAIDVQLPIYHGTEEKVLQEASGHLEWTSLPVGGENTHTVIAGHRGLPSSKLFTDLDRLAEGDTFTINVLNEQYTYEIDQIKVVLPSEIDDLYIVPGEDLCTLLTCTPYGINSHRLLVRGHRVA